MPKRKATRKAQKRGTKKAKTGSGSGSGSLSALDGIDVRQKPDVEKLKKLLGGNKVTLVLIYADWCGHCKTYKEGVWNKLKSVPNRNIPMAALNETQLASSPLASTKVTGFPTVALVGNDMKPATFPEEGTGEPSPNIPNSRDLTNMTTLVQSDPEKVLANNSMSASAAPTSATEPPNVNLAAAETLSLGTAPLLSAKEVGSGSATAEATAENAAFARNSASSVTPVGNTPPEVEDDMVSGVPLLSNTAPLNASAPRRPANRNSLEGEGGMESSMMGGSLYAAMLDAVRIAGPAALLTGLGTVAAKKLARKSRKRARRSRKAGPVAKNLKVPLRG